MTESGAPEALFYRLPAQNNTQLNVLSRRSCAIPYKWVVCTEEQLLAGGDL